MSTSKTDEIVYELYDLKNDPAETKNLSKNEPELVDTLSVKCTQWQRKCGIVNYAEILEMRPDHTK